MYVRLAFAVAAHLEPDVLIVDEVLAVGDASFQKKCLGKMSDVAKSGRTVLFVSHNMAAVRVLCARSLYLSEGLLLMDSGSDNVISQYLSRDSATLTSIEWESASAPRSPELVFLRAHIMNDMGETNSTIDCRRPFFIELEYEVLRTIRDLRIGFELQNLMGIAVTGSTDWGAWPLGARQPGRYVSRCTFPGNILNAGSYSLRFAADMAPHIEQIVTTPHCVGFVVEDVEGHGPRQGPVPGILRPKLAWEVLSN
jgi:lipopolysaccharide transport system ATP-binding protein